MTMTRKTITVTDQQEHWIRSQIQSGEFGNDSEYIRDLIRRDRSQKQALEDLRAALELGEASGEPVPLDIDQVKASARRRAG